MDYQDILKIATAWATILVALVAAGSLAYAAVQAHYVRVANEQSSKQARASFLLELDARFEGKNLSESRKLYRDTLDAINKTLNHRLADDARQEALAAAMAEKFNEWRNVASDAGIKNYVSVLNYLGFFETVGLMVNRGYIKIEDIDSLFRGPVLAIGVGFSQHIDDRQKETGAHAGLYENALYLLGEVQKRTQ